MYFTTLFGISLVLDFLFGDPRLLPHPVRAVGSLCEVYERMCRNVVPKPFVAGMASFILVLGTTCIVITALLFGLHKLNGWLEIIAAVYLVYSGVAYRDLQKHSQRVFEALSENASLDPARHAIQQIVGRDASQLDGKGIVRACVETVAENLVDGILSPIFWGVLFSLLPAGDTLHPLSLAAIGVYFYKSVNTMDSMYGYKNERYIRFGTTAARIDDLVNFVPARLSGLFLVISAFLLKMDYRRGWSVMIRDRYAHSSPNAGHPEAAVAGILGVRLGGPSIYFGKTVVKPTMGNPVREIQKEDILATNRLMLISTLLYCCWMLMTRNIIAG